MPAAIDIGSLIEQILVVFQHSIQAAVQPVFSAT